MKSKLLQKTLTLLLAFAVVFTFMPFADMANSTAWAEEAEKINVFVTISKEGVLATDTDGKPLVMKPVSVTDLNGDGFYSYDEAMQAFDKLYTGGNGYATNSIGWVTKLFDVETSNLSFVSNNIAIPNGVASDYVAEGDYLTASVNQDNENWGDVYAFFDANKLTVTTGTNFNLTLRGYGAMSGYYPKPIGNIDVVCYNEQGERIKTITGKTGNDGSVTLNISDVGTYYISAEGSTLGFDWQGNEITCPLIAPCTVVEVKAEELSDEDILQNAANRLLWNNLSNEISTRVTQKLTLPLTVDGVEIEWQKAAKISNKGAVTQKNVYDNESYDVLTATLKYNGKSSDKSFYHIVKQKFDVDRLSDDEKLAMIDKLIANISDVNKVKQELLPTLLSDPDYIFDVYAAGETLPDEYKNKFLKKVVGDTLLADSTSSVGYFAKDILALTAMGIDSRCIKYNDNIIDLFKRLYSADSKNLTVYNAPFILAAYNCCNSLTLPKEAKLSEETVLQYILTNQSEEGYWGKNYGTSTKGDAASILFELSNYSDREDVKAAIQKAKTFIESDINENAHFTSSNYNAFVILAYSMLGIDPKSICSSYTDLITGKTVIMADVLDALLSDADSSCTYFSSLRNTSIATQAKATSECLRALLAYKDFLNTESATKGKIYNMGSKTIAAANDFKSLKIETALIVSPIKSTYNKGDKINKETDFKVSVIFNENPKDVQEISSSDVSVNPSGKLNTPGTVKVEVSYNATSNYKITSIYNISVVETGTAVMTDAKVDFKITGLPGGTISMNSFAISNGETVMDVLKAVLNANGKTVSIKNGTYVASIDGLGEFDEGPNSGWMYRVTRNGETEAPNVSAADYKLQDGDIVTWYYTADYTKDYYARQSMITTKPAEPIVTKSTDGSVTAQATAEVKVTGGTAKATVDSKTATELVKQAKDNKATEVKLEVKAADTKNAKAIQAELPKSALSDIAGKTDAALVLATPQGEVKLDNKVLDEIAKAAAGTNVTIEIKAAAPTLEQTNTIGKSAQVIELTITSGSKTIGKFNGGTATFASELPKALDGKRTAAVCIKADGTLEVLPSKVIEVSGKKHIEFTTSHFSTFAIVDADEAGISEEQITQAEKKNEKLIAGVTATKMTAKSSITKNSKGKKAIKISWIQSKGYKVDYYEVWKSTKKNSGYKKLYTTADSKKKSLVTSKNLKKGKTYYFKVRGVRMIDGKKYYTNWSSKVSKTYK